MVLGVPTEGLMSLGSQSQIMVTGLKKNVLVRI